MTTSLLLDRTTNDLCLDAGGNLAICTEPYSIIQDVACACSVMAGDLWYDTAVGLPYKTAILGQNPPLAFLKQQFVDAALTVPGVVAAVCYISSTANREITGQVQVKTSAGGSGVVSLNGASPPTVLAAVTDTGLFGVDSQGFQITT